MLYFIIRFLLALALVATCRVCAGYAENAPVPLLRAGEPVKWWFVFKFNTASFPACKSPAVRQCIFGGGDPPDYWGGFGQQYVFASDKEPSLKTGDGCIGDTSTDPVGSTFAEVYRGNYYYLVWNDQFYNDPPIKGCGASCAKPWGHSKGILVWDEAGNGFVMQVTTPNWPGAASAHFKRKKNGNTLGCLTADGSKPQNNVKVSQHFFALRLDKSDVLMVIDALERSSVVTDSKNPQIFNGGPADIQERIRRLGEKSNSKDILNTTLSTGVQLIAKPSKLNVPPWQMVSSVLDRTPLRVATWWTKPQIPTTTGSTKISCWDESLVLPGRVEIAMGGHWRDTEFGLTGGPGPDFNHAKFGVSLTDDSHLTIFGDLNQQGALKPPCDRSQNGRGGLFFVLNDRDLFESVNELIKGKTAMTRARRK